MNETQYFYIQSRLGDAVLDTAAGQVEGKALTIVVVNARRTTDNDSQLWWLTPDGAVVNKKTGYVLDVYEGRATAGTPVIAFPVHQPPSANQGWVYDGDGILRTERARTCSTSRTAPPTPGTPVSRRKGFWHLTGCVPSATSAWTGR